MVGSDDIGIKDDIGDEKQIKNNKILFLLYITIFIALAGGIVLRFIFFMIKGDLSITEVIAFDLARLSLSEMHARLTLPTHDLSTISYQGGYLFHYLLHWWMKAGNSEVYLRSFSLLFGLITLAAVYFPVKRMFGKLPASVLVAFSAASPFLIQWSVPIRSYSLYLFLGTMATWSFIAMKEKSSYGVSYSVVMSAVLFTHHYGWSLLAAHWMIIVILLVTKGTKSFPFGRWILSQVVIFLVQLPMLPLFLDNSAGRGIILSEINLKSFIYRWPGDLLLYFHRIIQHFDYCNLTGHLPMLEIGAEILFIVLTIKGLMSVKKYSWFLFVTLSCTITVPFILHTMVNSAFDVYVDSMRYFLFTAPPLYLAWSFAVVEPSKLSGGSGIQNGFLDKQLVVSNEVKFFGYILFALMILVELSATAFSLEVSTTDRLFPVDHVIPQYEPWRSTSDWKSASTWIKENSRDNQVFLLDTGKLAEFMCYYLPGEERLISLFYEDVVNPRLTIINHFAALSAICSEICYIRMVNSSNLVCDNDLAAPFFREERHRRFGSMEVTFFRCRKKIELERSGICRIEEFFDAEPGQQVSFSMKMDSEGESILAVFAKSRNKPPYFVTCIIELDGKTVDTETVGASFGELRLHRFVLRKGEHRCTIRIVDFSGTKQTKLLERYHMKPEGMKR